MSEPEASGLTSLLTQPAGRAAQLGLGLGAAEESLTIVAFETFILFYYTQVVGLSGALAGAALSIALCVDAVLDPAFGVASDRLAGSRFGRRHTVMIAALVPLALSSVFLYRAPRGLGEIPTFIYLAFLCIMTRAAISGISIPLYAMGGELSRDPSERTTLLGLRTIGGGVGRFLAVYIGFTFFFDATTRYPRGQFNPAAYPAYGVYIGLLGVALAAACIYLTYGRIRSVERREAPKATPKFSIGGFFLELLRAFSITRNLRVAFVVSSSGYIIMALISVLKLHLATYFWRISSADTRSVVLSVAIGMLVGAPLAIPIVRRLDRKPAVLFGIAGFVASNLGAVALPAFGLFPDPATPHIVYALLLLQFLSGLFFGIFVVAGGSITADIADEHEVNTGKPQQGLVQGILFLAIKIGSALATLIAGLTLNLIHFPVAERVELVPPATVHRLVVVTAGVLLGVGLIVMTAASRYDVSAAKQREITRRLGLLKAGRSQAAAISGL